LPVGIYTEIVGVGYKSVQNRLWPFNEDAAAGCVLPAPLDSPLPCSRPLLTPDEAMRMKGARKNAQGRITEPGNMVIYVAGYPAIMGLQPLYFRDSELARRARRTA
jgi:hypothetical protein